MFTVVRRGLTCALTVVTTVGAVALMAGPAQAAAVASTGSVSSNVQYLNDSAGTVFTFTVRNTGTRGLDRISVTTPGTPWKALTCPAGPSGWTRTLASTGCIYQSSAGTAGDLAPGAATLVQLKSSVTGSTADRVGTWKINTQTAAPVVGTTATPTGPIGLNARAFSLQLTRVVVQDATRLVGYSCPDPARSAPTGSHKVLVVCGTNKASAAVGLSTVGGFLGGTFASGGTLHTGRVPAGAVNVVIADYVDAVVTSVAGPDKTVETNQSSSAGQTSPRIIFPSYTAINGTPTASPVSTTTNEDTAVSITLTGTDPDGDDTTIQATSSPTKGTLGSVTPIGCAGTIPRVCTASVLYTPTANATGSDSFTYSATDPFSNAGSATVNISITPQNDTPTNLALSPSSVSENQPSGTPVGTLSTTDPDVGDTFTYSLVAGTGSDDNALFQISGSTLQTAAALDAETHPTYTVRVQTKDSGNLVFEKALVITTNNVNEAPTDISLSPSTVPENKPSGTVVGTLSTTDVDSASFTYTLVTGTGSDDNASFSITGSSLKTAAVFDKETKASYTVRVRSVDSGGLPTEKALTITVGDANDAPTSISLDNSSVAENQPAGTAVGNLSGVDPDSDPLTFTIVAGDDGALFQVVGNQLQTAAVFDYEADNSYTLTVKASDGNGGELTKLLTITVSNANDLPTDIVLTGSTVPENSVSGATVGGLTFADQDVTDTPTYSLVVGAGDDDNASFAISGSDLVTSAVFDYEAKSVYTVRINVSDGHGGNYAEAFTITVTDVNEAPTNITLSPSSVPENSPSGTAVGTFSTTDPDGGSHTYTLVSGTGDDDNLSFSISGSTLSTTAVFDKEVKATYSVRVRSTDGVTTPFEKVFTITVTDANDAPTDITLTPSSIDENSAVGSTVGTLADADADAADTPTFTLVSGTGSTDNGAFTISGTALTTAVALDFETKPSYSIRVHVDDAHSGTFEKVLTVTVNNVNDAPTDIVLTGNTVPENSVSGTTVGGLTFVDQDATDTPTYSLVAGTGDDDNASFAISGTNLVTNAVFNFEAKNSYTVRISVSDGHSGSYAEVFTVTVTNVNDAPTDIALSNSSIVEHQAAGTAVGDFSTTDQDAGDTFTYALVAGTGSTDNAKFQISGNHLQMASDQPAGTYSIRVSTTDSGPLSFEKVFSITLTLSNQQPTDVTLSPSSIDENVGPNATVGTLTATDPDATDTHTFSLTGGADQAAFTITGNTLKLNAAADYEAKPSYAIQVSADDGHSGTFAKSLTVTVNNKNDAPTDIILNGSTVAENSVSGTTVGGLTFADQDSGDTPTFSLIAGTGDDDNASFAISGSNLVTNAVFNYEAKSSYTVRINVSDGHGGAYAEAFTVTVTDVNESPTNITLSPSSVPENSPSGTAVGTFSTTDPDGGSHTYTLVAGTGGDDNASFSISGSTLNTSAVFDREVKNTYTVRVRSTDGATTPFEKAFLITVTDTNDAPTDITLTPSSINENSAVGSTVGTLADIDQDSADVPTFTLVSGTGSTDNGSFTISGNLLKTAVTLDFETKSSYSIRVHVDDAHGGTFEKVLTVTVNDANDAPTDIALSDSHVDENSAIGTTVGTLSGTDVDVPAQTLTFSKVAGPGDDDNASFTVSGSNLNTAASFDFEAKSSYKVRLQVSDGTATYSEAFVITVDDVNEAPTASPLTLALADRAVGNTPLVVNDPTDGAPAVTAPHKTVSGDLLSGATDPDAGASLSVTPGTFATTGGGSITLESDGDFTYTPQTGDCSGNDTYTYTVTDGLLTDTDVITIGLLPCVWYVNPAAAVNGDGGAKTPLKAFNGINATSPSTTDSDSAGETIFVYAGTATGGLPLENTQKVYGEKFGLTVPDGSAGAGTTTLIAANAGAATALANGGVMLATGNIIQGLSFGDSGSASVASLSGTSVTSATVDTAAGGSGTVVNTSGPAVLIGGTGNVLAMAFDTVSSTNSASNGISIAGSSGSFSATNGTLTNATNADLNLSGNTAGFSYGGTITDSSGGTAVALSSNTGSTIDLTGVLNLTSTTAVTFAATGGGTVTAPNAANTLTAGAGGALNVSNTAIGAAGLLFRSVSSNGSATGISLSNTGSSGRLSVTGNGGTCTSIGTCTGGTIQNASGVGVLLANTLNPTFDRLNIQNTGNSGVDGTGLAGFTFTNGRIDSSGTASGVDDSNIGLNTTTAGTEVNVTGVVTITGNSLTNAYYHGIHIVNFGGTVSNAVITGNTITSGTTTTVSKGDGIQYLAYGTPSAVASISKATIATNTITNFPSGAGLRVATGNANAAGPAGTYGTAGNPVAINGNTISGASAANRIGLEGLIASVNGKGSGDFTINTNNISNTTGTAISSSAFGLATVSEVIGGNTIVANNTVASQGIGVGVDNTFGTTDTPLLTSTITNNNVSQTDGNGILAVARNSNGTLRAKIQNNNVAAPLTGVRPGIRIDSGTANGNATVCLNITGNASAGSGATQGIGLRRQSTNTNVFGVNGMSTATATPNVENYVNSLNPSGNGTLLISATTGFSNCSLP